MDEVLVKEMAIVSGFQEARILSRDVEEIVIDDTNSNVDDPETEVALDNSFLNLFDSESDQTDSEKFGM